MRLRPVPLLSLCAFLTALSGNAAAVDIDGRIDPAEWQGARRVTEFRTVQPLTGEAPVLYVVMKPERTFDPAAIRAALSAKLEDYMLPRRILERSSLPRAENGKLQRKLLK